MWLALLGGRWPNFGRSITSVRARPRSSSTPWGEKYSLSSQIPKPNASALAAQAKAAVNALELRHLLRGKKVPAPETLVKHYPELREMVEKRYR